MSSLEEGELTAEEEQESDGRGARAAFDAVAHYHASRAQPRSVRGLLRVVANARRIARGANRRLYAFMVAVQLASAVLLGAQVLLGKLAIQAVLREAGPHGSLGAVLPALTGLVVATALGTLATSFQTQLQRLLGEHVQRVTWASILGVTTRVPLATFESPAFFDDLQRVKANALVRPLTLAQGVAQLAGGLLGVVGISVALLFMQPLVLPVLLSAGIPLLILSGRTGRREFEFILRQTSNLRLRAYLTEALTERQEAKEIRAFDAAGVLRDRWDRNYRDYLEAFGRHIRQRVGLETLSAGANVVATTAALALLVWLVLDGKIALATAGAAIIAIRLLAGRIQQMFTGVSSLFESSLFLQDLESFLARAPETGPSRNGGSPVPAFRELRVEDVAFRYPESDRDALSGVSMTIRAGEVIALVGENGSGKTTLAKLLAQLFEPTGGRILWDGIDVRELDPRELRARLGVIFQDFVRYQLTARENVALGRWEAADDMSRLIDATRRADAHRYLESLPEGYETLLGKEFIGGYDLSGGQWQRVAIARAFFRDADFLILDEPTASLDARSEHRLFERVRELAHGRTVLLISHRFSTVRSADRIYVLDEGRVIEEGRHEELMSLGGRYAELFELQASSYR